MRLSKRTEYGLKAVTLLATRYGTGYLQSRELASTERLPAKFLESILLGLRSSKLLESKVGAGGGYRLSRSPDKITVHEIIDALEPGETDGEAGDTKPTFGEHAFTIIEGQLVRAFRDALEGMSVQDLCAQTEAMWRDDAPHMYYI